MLKVTFLQLPVSAWPYSQAHNSQREKGKEQDDSIPRKSWVSFIIYKFHFVHIFRDIKRLAVMQFVLSINANP